MRSLRGIGAVAGFGLAVGLVAAAGLLSVAGCSCKQSQPTHVVRVQPAAPAPAPAGQPAAAAQPAPAAKQPREYAPGPGAPGVGESVLRGPGEYLNTVTVTAPRYARKVIDLSYITHDIQLFQADKGRYPATLKELETWRGEALPAPPPGGKYSYDPATGKLEMLVAD